MTLRRRLVDWILAGLLIAIPTLVLRSSANSGSPSTLDKAVLRITAPLSAGVSWVVEGVGGLWSRYVGLVGVERENRELREENEKLRRELSTMSRRAFDVDALEQLAELKRKTPADTLGARVIGAPLSPFFRVLRIRIDRGQHEVDTGMPVISAAGLVGRIAKTYGEYADVMLVSDPGSSVDVLVPSTGGRGVLTGLGKTDSYGCQLQWLERPSGPTAPGTELKVGDAVYMSDIVESGAAAKVGLVMIDGTTFGLGENGELVLDELTYNPATHGGTATVSLLKGAAGFVSGTIAKSGQDAMQFKTPVGTIGIRGTKVFVSFDPVTGDVTILNRPTGVTATGQITAGEIFLSLPDGTPIGAVTSGNGGFSYTTADRT